MPSEAARRCSDELPPIRRKQGNYRRSTIFRYHLIFVGKGERKSGKNDTLKWFHNHSPDKIKMVNTLKYEISSKNVGIALQYYKCKFNFTDGHRPLIIVGRL